MNSGPEIIANGPMTETELKDFMERNNVKRKTDIYEQQIIELNSIRYKEQVSEVWFYYPWLGAVLHCVDSDALFALRTNRNKLLITDDEQRKLRRSVVGVAGMSVGSGIAMGVVYSGISDTIKIADRDTLDTSNLNRLRESLLSVGKPKTELSAQHIYELNPFADVRRFDSGITPKTIDEFFTEPKLSVVVDEIDDFKMKVQLRLKAREYGIPLLMFTSLGDNILVDVERYDLDSSQEIFNGFLVDIPQAVLANPQITPEDIRRYSVQLVGQEYVPTRALESLSEMGKSLAGRPQLYSTIAVDGGAAAYTIRQIVLGGALESGRYYIRFADWYRLDNDDLSQTSERTAILRGLGLS